MKASVSLGIPHLLPVLTQPPWTGDVMSFSWLPFLEYQRTVTQRLCAPVVPYHYLVGIESQAPAPFCTCSKSSVREGGFRGPNHR